MVGAWTPPRCARSSASSRPGRARRPSCSSCAATTPARWLLPDAEIIPMEPGKGPSKAARMVGNTGPKPTRPVRPATPEAAADAPEATVPVKRKKRVLVEPEPSAAAELAELVENPTEEGWLDFARRRLSGDYGVDDFGFDPELTDRVFLAMARPLYRSWFRVEVRGIENIPAEAARSSSPTTPARSRSTRSCPARHPRRAPAEAASCACSAPTSSSRCRGRGSRARPGHAGRPTPTPSGSSPASSSGCGPRASRVSASPSRSATSSSASAAAASSRRPCAPRCPDHPVPSSGPRRSTRSSAT
jgi:hypothetical protein